MPALQKRLAGYAADFAAGARWRYAVVDPDGQRLLGGASLHPYPGPGALEVGYWVRSSELRRGIASTAAAALTRHAFIAHGVERVEIWCDETNLASAAVAEALGFARAGSRVSARSDGTARDLRIYRLSRMGDLRCPPGAQVRIEDGEGAAGWRGDGGVAGRGGDRRRTGGAGDGLR